jgi:NADP-dependent 3-hydroxy acid dehydrogenase YdfG
MVNILGKKVLITGGTTGIGRATAVLLAKNGAEVFIFGRHEGELQDALGELNKISDKHFGIAADASTKEGLEKIFEYIDRNFGVLDVLVNNAGIGSGDIFQENYEWWNYVLKTNTLGYIGFSRYAADRMNEGGHIVNIGSLSAETKDAGSEAYVASKAAVQAFSDALRKNVNSKGIKVSLIEPGSVGTDMPAETRQEQLELQKEEKMLKAEDIAEAVLFCLNRPSRTEVMAIKIKPLKQII